VTVIDGPRIDFDHHSPDYRDNWERMAAALHAHDYPIARSEHHGGFWVIGSWEGIHRIATDWETFSSDNDPGNERSGARGVVIPPTPYPLMLTESDPPLSTARRQIEAPFFLPRALRGWEEVARHFLDDSLGRIDPRATVDLVDEIVIPTTARTTLSVLGFDIDNWRDAALSAHRSSYTRPGSSDYPAEEMTRLRAEFRRMLDDRRDKARGDLVSALAHGSVQGRPLTTAEAESMMSAMVFGGFDTTTTLTLNALIWLDRHREEHARLVADPAYLHNAVEEILRVFPSTGGLARNVMRDVDIGGQRLRAGERIYLWLAAGNRDPHRFADPTAVRLGRENAREHLSFSAGAHRCLGAPLAKLEARIMIATILSRFPDYRIDHDGLERYPSYGSILGLSRVPIRLEPGAAVRTHSKE